MDIRDYLFGNNVKAENLDKIDFKNLNIVKGNKDDVTEVLYYPLQKDVSCKTDSDNSCCFYQRLKYDKHRSKEYEVGYQIEGAKVYIDENNKKETQAVITVLSDSDKIVITPYIANQDRDNLEMVRNYGKPIVFSGEIRGELLHDYLIDNKLDFSDKKEFENDVESVPVVIPSKLIGLLRFQYLDSNNMPIGVYNEVSAYSLESELNSDGRASLKTSFSRGKCLMVKKESYLDEKISSANEVELKIKDIRVKKDKNGNTLFEFYVPYEKGQYTHKKASFIKWVNDPMRNVELNVGTKEMNAFRDNLCVLRLRGSDLIDYEATNNDVENKKAGLFLSNVEIAEHKFGQGYSTISKITNVVRETGSLDSVMNIHLKFNYNNEEWRIKVPAKSLYTFSCKHGASFDKSGKPLSKVVKDFCIALDKNQLISLDIQKVENEKKSDVLHIEGEVSKVLPISTKSYSYECDYNEENMMKHLTEYIEKHQEKVFQPISLNLSADERKDVLFGSKGKEKFIVLRNLGEKFSVRLDCTSIETKEDGSLYASIKPMQVLTLNLGKESMKISVCDKNDLDRLVEINKELGQYMSVETSKSQKNNRKRQNKTLNLSKNQDNSL